MSKFVHVQWWDEQEMLHDEIINAGNIEKVYVVLPFKKALRMAERDRDMWHVKELLYRDERECAREYYKILDALVEE